MTSQAPGKGIGARLLRKEDARHLHGRAGFVGGTAQGIGMALYEEMPYDISGQPLASTLADYLLPGAAEVPRIRIYHVEIPSPYTAHGIKGCGEGGALGAPGAIVGAINDALRPLGAELNATPATPRRILDAIRRSREGAKR